MSKGKLPDKKTHNELVESIRVHQFTGINGLTRQVRASYGELSVIAGAPVLGKWTEAVVEAARKELGIRDRELKNFRGSANGGETSIISILNGTTARSTPSSGRG